MNVVVVRVDGGLGNQMSQYAFYKKLGTYYKNSILRVDYSIYKKANIHNGFELFNVFDIDSTKAPQATRFEIIKSRNVLFGGKIINQIYESGYPEHHSFYEMSDKSNKYFCGTWHSSDYTNIMKDLRKDFKFIKPLSKENSEILREIQKSESVSIHVRRGDYLAEGLDIVNKDYYRRAVDIIMSKCEVNQFFVFSDDKEFIYHYFDFIPKDRIKIVGGNFGKDSYIDMQLMSCCKHNIIANSTFSYWAALLNDNPDKIVIRPFMQTKDRESWDIKGWIRLK